MGALVSDMERERRQGSLSPRLSSPNRLTVTRDVFARDPADASPVKTKMKKKKVSDLPLNVKWF